METKTIVNLLKALGNLCLVLGGIAALLCIGYCIVNASVGIPMLIMSIFAAIFGYITSSAMANMMEAVDSISETNKSIVEVLQKSNLQEKELIMEIIESNKHWHDNIENKIVQPEIRAKEKAHQERISAYWTEHTEEKQQLEAEKSAILKEIEQLTAQIAPFEEEISEKNAVPSKAAKYAALDELGELNKQLNNLGTFNVKEKKAFEEKISAVNARIASLNAAIKDEEKIQSNKIKQLEEKMQPAKAKITILQNRLAEINNELTKDR